MEIKIIWIKYTTVKIQFLNIFFPYFSRVLYDQKSNQWIGLEKDELFAFINHPTVSPALRNISKRNSKKLAYNSFHPILQFVIRLNELS